MVSLRPVDISLSQLYGRVAARGGDAAKVEKQELEDSTPQVETTSADADGSGEVTLEEFTAFTQAQATPLTITDSEGKTYQISVNPDGTTQVAEVMEEENAEDTQSAEDLAPAATASAASPENGADETRAIIEQVLASLRAAKANIRKQIDEIEKKNREEQAELEKIAARKAVQRKLEQAEAALAALEARLNALINVSPQQRALILTKLQSLQQATQTLETLSAPEQIDAQIQIIEDLTVEIEKNLDEEEVKNLAQVFGEDLSVYILDPKKALDDGVINAEDLTDTGKAVLQRYFSAQITFGELQDLAEKGLEDSRLKFANLLGLDSATDASNKAYDELLAAARAGELDADRWNEIMEENGFKAFSMNSNSFAALLLGEGDSVWVDETVSGTLNLDRAMVRIHMTMVSMGGTDRLADTFMTYAGNTNFFFIDFQRQGRVFLEALGLDSGMSIEDRMAGLLADAEGGLKEILDQLYGRRFGEDIPEEFLTEAAQKRFRHMSAPEQWDTVVALLLNRVFSSIQVPREGKTDREIFEEESRIFEDILTEIQDIPTEVFESVISGPEDLIEQAPRLEAYMHEVQWTIFRGESQTINYEAILDGRVIDHPDPTVIPQEASQTTVAEVR